MHTHAMDAEAIARVLHTDVECGLDIDVARQRLQEGGRNVITAVRKRGTAAILLDQFKSPIVYVLLIAAILSLVLGENLDAIAIVVVIVINTGIGFFLEFQAERSMNELSALSAATAAVLRSGKRQTIEVADIVQGDIVVLEAGDLIPADGRVVYTTGLQIDESALTGESIPVEKDPHNLEADIPLAERTSMTYRGTHVTRGSGRMLVTATGMATELGRIAGMVSTSSQNTTPLEKKLQTLTVKMIAVTVVIASIVLVAGLASGRDAANIFRVMLALSVAAIPEGLPIVATVALARGMLRMARRNVVVKYLSSVETIGAADVICTDKTGTLTENTVVVERIVTTHGQHDLSEDGLLKDEDAVRILSAGFLCNNAIIHEGNATGDPLEIALMHAASKAGIDTQSLLHSAPRLAEEPFSSETKVMATLHQNGHGYIVYAKGATEELVKSSQDSGRWLQEEHRLASEGLRVLGFAYAEHAERPQNILEGLQFVGLVGMADPLRADVKDAIQECLGAGIRVIMITGDHPTTALKIGKELGIATEDRVVTGREMSGEPESVDWLQANIFARVSPEHKLDLVTALQKQGHVVVMTGDGINDAPALKKADVGIAMGGRGVAVAQDVADVVIKDDSFTSVVYAVEQGRIIFDNIRAFIIYLLSGNLSELLVVGATALLNVPFQLLALQILFINLMSDVLPALALGFTKGGPDIMRAKPHGIQEPLIAFRHWRAIGIYGIVIATCCLGAALSVGILPDDGHEVMRQNNVFFFTLVLSQMLHVFNMGSRHALSSGVLRNGYVWLALAVNVIIIALAHVFAVSREVLAIQTIGYEEWVVVFAFSALSFILNYLAKKVLSRVSQIP